MTSCHDFKHNERKVYNFFFIYSLFHQLSATILGLLSGPVLGLFLVGATLPFVSGVVSVLQCHS